MKIALINPRFDVSYWGQEYAMPIFGKKANMPVASLPLLAALTPSNHHVTLVDENVEELDFEQLRCMDVVGVTGMSVQRFRAKEILHKLKKDGVLTVAGGAWASVDENYFRETADVIFVGESEETWPEFLHDVERGRWKNRYVQESNSDMSKVPVPKFSLLKMDNYLYGSIQISRGCPFLCEFCDIIVTFGRRPRLKSSTQVIAELNELRNHGMKQIFIVDDNLIGNKAGVKVVLKDIIRYQEQHRYPFRFLTEATLDLAEDDEMMDLMAEANINAVFIGIESPKKESLAETRKYQNIRPHAGTLLQRVTKIQTAGIEVACGMIVGFDNDDESIFAAQEQFLTEASIPHAMIGMLYAIPKTPLYERLLIEKRLDSVNEGSYGTNVIPMNMTRDMLREGYINVMRYMNQTSAYFERVDALYLHGRLAYQRMGRFKFLKEHRLDNLMAKLRSILYCTILCIRIIKNVKNRGLRREYLGRTVRCLLRTRDVTVCLSYLVKCAIHYHNHKLVEGLSNGKLVSTM